MIKNSEYWELLNVDQRSQFQSKISEIVFDKEQREAFYKDLLTLDVDIKDDLFRGYFENYAAERKSMQQDFTPHSVTRLISKLVDDSFSSADFTAGTGAMLIEKWNKDRMSKNPFEYYPSDYIYYAQEYSDEVIPYLIHNIAIRGMNAVVIHGDTLTMNVKQIYFIQNDNDDFLAFSSVNVMPHSEEVKRYFKVNEWAEEAIDHKESPIELILGGTIDENE